MKGQQHAGLILARPCFVLMAIGVWLVSVSITSVGVISFYWIDCAKHRETFGLFKGEASRTHRKLRVRCTVAV
ncbi:hypothetical protein OK016_24160 [Vibrio chagasii]|nr:hypothetical protein [Vibrio chagasii]